MPLSWNEIKDRALKYSRKWADETSEDAEAKSFLDEFFEVFGVPRERVATFEHRVKKQDGKDGYIDLLWKGILLVEHKSRGKDLDRAFQQAKDYFPGLKDRDAPRYVLVCDFARFRLYDLEQGEQHEFTLKEFYKNVRLFGFVAGYQTTTGFMSPDTLVSDLVFVFSQAQLYHFGVLSSAMHMGWMRNVCGRLESRYRYSAGIVYNNFPWPEIPPNPPFAKGGTTATASENQTHPPLKKGGRGDLIEAAAQAVLDARAKYPNSSLADLYYPLTMPPELVKAHHKLDAAVDAAYSKRKFSGDSDRVAFLFERYQKLVSQPAFQKAKPQKMA